MDHTGLARGPAHVMIDARFAVERSSPYDQRIYRQAVLVQQFVVAVTFEFKNSQATQHLKLLPNLVSNMQIGGIFSRKHRLLCVNLG